MAIHRKLDEFRVLIRREQKEQYFSSVRCSLLRDLKQLEAVESAQEEEVIRWIDDNAANSALDFAILHSFLNYNAGRLSPYFAQQLTRRVLDHFQHSDGALLALCILLENEEFTWQESGTRLYCLVGEGRESQLLESGVFIAYKLFQSSQRKETFLWLAEQYEMLVGRLGCNVSLLLLLLQLSQYEELMPSEQVLLHLMGPSSKECTPWQFVRICKLASYFRKGSAALRFEVVRWAANSLKEHSHQQCTKASLQVLSEFSFQLDRGQTQAVLRSGLIDQLVSLSKDVPSEEKALLLRCLCDFLNSLQNDLFQSLLPNHSLYETLAASLSLELSNSVKFSLLASLSLIFAADPSSLAYLGLDLLPRLFEWSDSPYTQLREISCMMIEEYKLDR